MRRRSAIVIALLARLSEAGYFVQGEDRILSPALAESVLRTLLADVPPQRFQHLMRIIRNDYFMLLDTRAMCR